MFLLDNYIYYRAKFGNLVGLYFTMFISMCLKKTHKNNIFNILYNFPLKYRLLTMIYQFVIQIGIVYCLNQILINKHNFVFSNDLYTMIQENIYILIYIYLFFTFSLVEDMTFLFHEKTYNEVLNITNHITNNINDMYTNASNT